MTDSFLRKSLYNATMNLSPKSTPETLQLYERTWYGLDAEITVTESNFHRVKLPKITLPHPGVVNCFSRLGLPINIRLALTARHEFGHLQTLPVPILHLLLLFLGARGMKKPLFRGWSRFWLVFLTHQTLWEVAAESYVVLTDRRAITTPRPHWARGLYALFWGGIIVFSAAGTFFLLRTRNE
jgi:hypothetical protein